jgi:3-phenylpropionate/cinnamic acid dioxygenase small subunit
VTVESLVGPTVADHHLRDAVADLYDDYIDALDDGPIERWPELFTEDGSYLLIAKENHDRGLPVGLMRCESRGMLVDRVQSITRLSTYAPRVLRHVIGPLRIRPSGSGEGIVAVSASYVVFQTLVDADTQVLSCGRYLDEVVAGGDGLRFRRKVTVYDNPLVPNSIIYPL